MKTKRGLALILGGLLLIVAALGLTTYNLLDNQRVKKESETVLTALNAMLPEQHPARGKLRPEAEPELQPGAQPQQQAGVERGETPQEATLPGHAGPEDVLPDYVLNPELPMPERPVDGYTYIALLKIPALGLELPVMGDWDYERLRTAPCRYVGSIYTDNLVIMAHNYDSHFGRIYSLGIGDEVSLTDMHGNVFRYRVTEQEVLDGDDAEPIITGDWDLTLFTCTIGGLSRVTVRCERI